MSEPNKNNPFFIVETAVLRRKNPENGLGLYYVIAKTADGLLYQRDDCPQTVDGAIMWAEMLEGTVIVNDAQNPTWYPLVKVL